MSDYINDKHSSPACSEQRWHVLGG